MTSESLLLIATQSGQALLAIVLAGLLFRFHRVYQRRFLRDWARSWAMMALFMVGAIMSMLASRILGSAHPAVFLLSALGAVAGYLQLGWLLCGTAEIVRKRPVSAASRTRVAVIAVATAVISASLYTWDPAAGLDRFFVRVGVRTLVAGLAFLGAAFAVWRASRHRPWLGPKLLWTSLAVYGIEQLHYFLRVYQLTRGADLPSYVTILGVGDLILNAVTALGMVVWMLEEERDRAVQLEERVSYAEKMQSLGTLAGGVAHDFNNLLTGIVAGSAMLGEELQGSAAAGGIREIKDLALQAAGLARQMLTYAGKAVARKAAVDVSDLAREMAQLLRTVVSRNASIEYQLATGLPTTVADPGQLRQVVMNLITNASDALGAAPGSIEIATGLLDDLKPSDDLMLEPPEQRQRFLWISVKDTGRGMSTETRARMFDPYFTTKMTGRGLGLATVFGIMREHQGGIAVASAPGSGTKVTVFLPVFRAEAQHPHATEKARPAKVSKAGTVLVVDDEPSVREASRRVLESAGFSVLTAADGMAALEVLRQPKSPVQAVVLDLFMPRLDGRATFSALREMFPFMPVLVFSGYASDAMVGWVDDQPRAAFLAKPFEPAELIQAVRDLLDPEPAGAHH